MGGTQTIIWGKLARRREQGERKDYTLSSRKIKDDRRKIFEAFYKKTSG